MVFPRKAGFGRCYLVSKRYDILSNIDRNLTGTRLRLRKTEINKCRESANPIPVLLLSFESQTVVFQLFDFHLRKFKKFIIKKSSTSTIRCANIELDNGQLLEMKKKYLDNGYAFILSIDYDKICKTVHEYMRGIRVPCNYCNKLFVTLRKH